MLSGWQFCQFQLYNTGGTGGDSQTAMELPSRWHFQFSLRQVNSANGT